MKVCKFEKIKDEDEMKQVINCIQKEHPYVAVVLYWTITGVVTGYFHQLVSRRR